MYMGARSIVKQAAISFHPAYQEVLSTQDGILQRVSRKSVCVCAVCLCVCVGVCVCVCEVCGISGGIALLTS